MKRTKRMTEWFCKGICALAITAAGMMANTALAEPPGPDVCKACHPKFFETFTASQHGNKADPRTPAARGGCVNCHGDGTEHVKAGGGRGVGGIINPGSPNIPAEVKSEKCLACHQGGKRTLWEGSQHPSHDVACSSCHKLHSPEGDKVLVKATQRQVCYTCHQTQRAEAQRISTHPIEAGKVACSNCHNPHGSDGPKLLVEKTVRDTCFTCHAEKRGPFLFEHPPASDDCMNCHTPHGSTNPPLLIARMPWLCQGCHGDSPPHPGNIYSGASLPGGAVANANTKNPVLNGAAGINRITGQSIALNNPPAQLAFRSCANCHTQVHGSNHPGGERFTR